MFLDRDRKINHVDRQLFPHLFPLAAVPIKTLLICRIIILVFRGVHYQLFNL